MTLPPLGTRPCFWDNDFFSLQFCSIDLGKRAWMLCNNKVSHTNILPLQAFSTGRFLLCVCQSCFSYTPAWIRRCLHPFCLFWRRGPPATHHLAKNLDRAWSCNINIIGRILMVLHLEMPGCMYVCVWESVFVCSSVHACVYVCVCMVLDCVCIYRIVLMLRPVFVQACVCICVFVCVSVSLSPSLSLSLCVCMCVYVHAHVQVRMYVCACVCMRVHVHVSVSVCLGLNFTACVCVCVCVWMHVWLRV